MNPTTAELELIDTYKDCIKNLLPYQVVKFPSTSQLINFLQSNNHSDKRYIYMLSIQRCYDPYQKKLLNKLFVLRLVSKYNKSHLDFTSNCIFSQYANIMLSIGPDFFEMGKLLCYQMMEYINTGKFIPKVYKPEIYVSVKFDRLKNSPFFRCIYEQISPLVDKNY
jgi:hypothetical protein